VLVMKVVLSGRVVAVVAVAVAVAVLLGRVAALR
jgi:hypothetical protein